MLVVKAIAQQLKLRVTLANSFEEEKDRAWKEGGGLSLVVEDA